MATSTKPDDPIFEDADFWKNHLPLRQLTHVP